MSDKQLCTARSKQSGEQCKRYAAPGQKVCKIHGGGSPQANAAAERRQQEEAARAAVSAYGLPINIDPHTALLQEVRRTAGHVAALEVIVGELQRDRLTYGVTKTVQLPDNGRHVTVEAAVNVWVRLLMEERRHLVHASATAIRVGVEQRRVELEERQGQLIADVFRKVYDDPELGLSDKQRKTAMVATARHLRVISGGAA